MAPLPDKKKHNKQKKKDLQWIFLNQTLVETKAGLLKVGCGIYFKVIK